MTVGQMIRTVSATSKDESHVVLLSRGFDPVLRCRSPPVYSVNSLLDSCSKSDKVDEREVM